MVRVRPINKKEIENNSKDIIKLNKTEKYVQFDPELE